jgi:iron complex transport system ATP-binding protein
MEQIFETHSAERQLQTFAIPLMLMTDGNPNMIARQSAIDLQKVTVKRNGRAILRNVSWHVAAGECVAILGPNGSGKSTLARVIMGQIWPTTGAVSVLGQRFGETDLNQLRSSIRLVQSHGVVEFDAEETTLNVALTGFFGTVGLYDAVTPAMKKIATALLAQVGLKKEIHQPYRTLSSGERMRCLIARALVVEPRLLILDEPTAGLDVLAREQVLATVQRIRSHRGGAPAVLMITHHVEELLPSTSQVLLLDDGTVSAIGKPGEVIRAGVLSKVYGCPVHVSRRGGRYWLQVDSAAWKGLGGDADR